MGRNADEQVQLRFPARAGYLDWVHLLFGRLADECRFDEVQRNRFLVTVSEAFTNAVTHGCRDDAGKSITVEIQTGRNCLEVSVADHGDGLAAIPPEGVWDDPNWERENGRGLNLIRRLTDEYEFFETAGGGLTVRMRYHITPFPANADTYSEESTKAHSHKGEAMELHVKTSGELDVIHVSGRLDLVGANTLKDEVRRRLQDRRTQIVLNLKKVDFINSSGLGALVSVLKDVRLVNGRLVLSDLAPYVQEIFTITQLANVFELFETEQQAHDSFAKPAVV